MKGWLKGRIWNPVVELLRQGLSPEGLAWSLAVGLAVGTIPLFGTSTLICIGLGVGFRLNQPALQLANYLAYPLQLALLLPFIRLGERLFHAPRLPLSLAAVTAAMQSDFWGGLRWLWTSLWHGSVAWALAVPVPTALLAWALVPLFRTFQARFRRPGSPDSL